MFRFLMFSMTLHSNNIVRVKYPFLFRTYIIRFLQFHHLEFVIDADNKQQ